MGWASAAVMMARVERLVEQELEQDVAAFLLNRQLDAGELPVEPRQQRGQTESAYGGDGADEHTATLEAAELLHLHLGGLDQVEDLLGRLDEVLAGGREADATGGPLEQGDAELALELSYLVGKGRLGERESLGSAGE